jgi:hypothetical protein
MEKLVLTTLSREDLKEIFKECLKEEIGKIKILPESQNFPIAHLTVKDLTLLFHISKVTVRNWTLKGILKAYKTGNRVFYKREEVESILKDSSNPLSDRLKYEKIKGSGIWMKVKELEAKNGIPFEEDLGPAAELLRKALNSEKRMKNYTRHD